MAEMSLTKSRENRPGHQPRRFRLVHDGARLGMDYRGNRRPADGSQLQGARERRAVCRPYCSERSSGSRKKRPKEGQGIKAPCQSKLKGSIRKICFQIQLRRTTLLGTK